MRARIPTTRLTAIDRLVEQVMELDAESCDRCGGTLLYEVTRAGEAATWCGRCKVQHVVPRRHAPKRDEGRVARDGPVTGPCLICGAPIVTEWRAGSARQLVCDHHTVLDRVKGLARLPNGRLKCTTSDCPNPARSRGKCRGCYAKWWRKMRAPPNAPTQQPGANDGNGDDSTIGAAGHAAHVGHEDAG